MAARFRVVDTFNLQSRRYFVIYGDILEGVVRAGMDVVLPCESLGGVRRPITSVEFVDNIGDRKAWLGLVVEYASDEDLASLRVVKLKGCELDICEVAPLASGQ
jgi:hypothetical protein